QDGHLPRGAGGGEGEGPRRGLAFHRGAASRQAVARTGLRARCVHRHGGREDAALGDRISQGVAEAVRALRGGRCPALRARRGQGAAPADVMALQIRFFMTEEDEREVLRCLERLELELWPELTDPAATPPIASPSVPLEAQ